MVIPIPDTPATIPAVITVTADRTRTPDIPAAGIPAVDMAAEADIELEGVASTFT